ncbi:hypothetical protein CTAYLR_004981 [Chrysophaeum taylorii]|uniref:Uncharacterized protein n=1 Tax=Chrysophaeum taylorii TaxID=2483200 RepID=A0AAD7UQB4_9STRA|nr:hypothetical protein CTAYLR_004981 [Chrysophaeum taylorii]
MTKQRTRRDAEEALKTLERRLREFEAKKSGICPKREALYLEALDNLLSQIEGESPETACLLRCVRNERRMTLACHLELHRAGLALSVEEASRADSAVRALQTEHDELVQDINRKKLRIASLSHEIASLEAAATQAKAIEDRLHQKQLDALQTTRRFLASKQSRATVLGRF